jgi:bifunctional non-homologous end joining protein LigD
MVKRTKPRPIEGAKPSAMPGFIKPQLATLKSKAPKGPQWLHEIKYDGYRVQIHLDKGKKKVFTRNGLDWTKRFSVIAGALDVPGQAIIDGEVVVIMDGRTNFSELQAELAAGHQDRLVFYAFDLLHLNGFDLRGARQVERKATLEDLLHGIEAPVVYSEHLIGDGQEMFEYAAKHRLQERRRALPIRPERSVAQNQNGSEGKISRHRVRERPDRGRRLVPWQAGGQRPRLHGQGRHGLVPNRIQPDQETA